MSGYDSNRSEFVKFSAAGIGGLALSSFNFKTLEEFRGLQAGVKAAEGFILFKPRKEMATLTGL